MMSSVLYITYFFVRKFCITSMEFRVVCVILNDYDINEIQANDFSDNNNLRSLSSSFRDELFGHRGR